MKDTGRQYRTPLSGTSLADFHTQVAVSVTKNRELRNPRLG